MITPEQLAAPNTEHSHQVALFCAMNIISNEWLAKATRYRGSNKERADYWERMALQVGLMFAIPNGGLRHIAVAGRLKAEGVKAGVPDIFLPVPQHWKNAQGHVDGSWIHGLFIEMKKPDQKAKKETSKGGVSDQQQLYKWNLEQQGYAVAVCYSWIEAKDAILKYMGVNWVSGNRPKPLTLHLLTALNRTLCGFGLGEQAFAGAYYSTSELGHVHKITTLDAAVTCKRCLKEIEKCAVSIK